MDFGMEVESGEKALKERTLEGEVRSFEDVAVCNHELCDEPSEFGGEPMALLVFIGFREDCADGVGFFEAGSNVQGLVKYVVYAEQGQCVIFSGLHLRQCSRWLETASGCELIGLEVGVEGNPR